jgi:hypothetical protein
VGVEHAVREALQDRAAEQAHEAGAHHQVGPVPLQLVGQRDVPRGAVGWSAGRTVKVATPAA